MIQLMFYNKKITIIILNNKKWNYFNAQNLMIVDIVLGGFKLSLEFYLKPLLSA